MTRIQKILLGALVGLLCGAAGQQSAKAQSTAETMSLRVMTFNIWLGGDQVNFAKVIEAIRAADADVVFLQEPNGNTAAIAAALGWTNVIPSRHMLARVPLFAPPAATMAADGNDLNLAYAEVVPGGFVALANLHLPSDPYGPYLLRDGKPVEEVLKNESDTRLAAVTPYIAPLSALAKGGTPVIVAGDFNSPSPLDWTPAAAQRWSQAKAPIVWPAAQALLDAGFADAYRSVHPDPAAKPGITWTYGYPYPHIEANEAQDRIDLMFSAGPAKAVKSEVLGDPRMPDTDIAVSPWPSDHRAVVSTFEVTPGTAPAMVSPVARRVAQGEPAEVRFHAATPDGRLEGGHMVLLPGDAAADAAPLVSLASNNGTDRSGSVAFGTAGLAPGAYVAALRDAGGKELARAPLWVTTADNSAVTMETDKPSYAPGDPIVVSFANAPGNRYDWVGLYKKGNPADDDYIVFVYVNAAVAGSVTLDEAAIGAKLEPGDYEARLELDDGYTRLGTVAFSVK
jgi:endonuclease/exonuclease/phosphatase family metal-dependent hydrolase